MKWMVSAALVAMAGVVACDKPPVSGFYVDGGTVLGCNIDPWGCTDETTCSLAEDGKMFLCRTQGDGKIGDKCKTIVDQPQCKAGLICFQLLGTESGVCAPYCDLSKEGRTCPNDETCLNVQFGEAGIARICRPEKPDAGGAGGAASTTTAATTVAGSAGGK